MVVYALSIYQSLTAFYVSLIISSLWDLFDTCFALNSVEGWLASPDRLTVNCRPLVPSNPFRLYLSPVKPEGDSGLGRPGTDRVRM